MKTKIISESSLSHALNVLKREFSQNICDKNIIFLNMEGFYLYIDEFCDNGSGLSELIAKIEPYIPLTVSDENIRMLLEAALKPDNEAKDLEQQFINSSKVRFLNLLFHAGSEKEWDEISSVCLEIRNYIEQGVM